MLKPWTPVSFEFFPPRTEAQQHTLNSAWPVLADLKPEYFSVTFGAGGSNLDATHQAVLGLQRDSGVPIAPHISCKVESRELLSRYLDEYAAAGVRRLVVLRGDRQGGQEVPGPFKHANELVEAVRELSGDQFSIEVGCYPEFHPESVSPDKELMYFKQKVDAGATGAITQYFYNVEAYFRFIAECETAGITIPIRPGILPITNRDQLLKFSGMCGAEVPRWITKRLDSYGDDIESIREFGLDVVTELCKRLLMGGAPGLHIYTLNQSEHSLRLINRLTA
ncbi:MAG: methylenetetrahydrofolate reductase (NADPH) [Lysobacterales bacterium]|jgi:methylenetetrahydrofolate reductase (NADPH)